MRAQPVTWPVLSGALPPLAEFHSDRPETGLGQRGTLDCGMTTLLAPPDDASLPGPPEPSGTGKTMLAAGIAHGALAAATADLVVWINAASRAGILAGYAEALAAVGGAGPGDGPDAAAARLLAWLATATRPWLLVLDDVADPAALEGLWPSGPLGQVLVTLRHAGPGLAGPGRRIRAVGAFSRREALTYLSARLTDHPDQRTGALDLAEDLGFQPLGLALAAAVITDSGTGCRQYRELFAERREQLAAASGTGRLPAVTVAWTLAVDRANQLDPAGLAWPALVLAAVLDPGGIPAAVLSTQAACDFITGGPAADLTGARRQVRDAIGNLARLGLATVDSASAERTVRVHAANQAAALGFLNSGDLGLAAQAAADALAQAWPPRDVPPPLGQALRDCTARLAAATSDLLWKSGGHTVLARAGRSLADDGLYGAAIEYWRDLIGVSGRLLGPRHSLTLMSRDSLAAAYEQSGRSDDAILLYQRAVGEQEQVLGPLHPDTLAARASLAHAYQSAGRMAEAIPLFELTLRDLDTELGPAHPVTVAVRGNLSAAYEEAGRLPEAIAVRERVLADCERVLGPAHTDTLTARGALAAACHAAGRLKQALPHYRRTLADREQIQGPDHPDTITARGKLAYAQRSAGRLKDAIPLYQQTLASREKVQGALHPDTITARANLASACHSAGRLRDAIPLYERALADREQVQGADHPDTLTARGNLASAYHSAGRMTEALPLYEQALADCERVLGPAHRDTLTSKANLAQAYATARRMTDAVQLLQRTLAECEAALGPASPMTEAVRESLAAIRG